MHSRQDGGGRIAQNSARLFAFSPVNKESRNNIYLSSRSTAIMAAAASRYHRFIAVFIMNSLDTSMLFYKRPVKSNNLLPQTRYKIASG